LTVWDRKLSLINMIQFFIQNLIIIQVIRRILAFIAKIFIAVFKKSHHRTLI